MKKNNLIGKLFADFSKAEFFLWGTSLCVILLSYLFFDRGNALALAASLVGASALIFCSKGNPIGQLLIIVFAILYGIISYTFAYYGEMITYLGMSAPMALFALIAWLRHPYKGNRSQVEINHISQKEWGFAVLLTLAVTVAFYFILGYFGTANLIPSTISVMTSFFAVYLTYRRSPYYAVAYALNDIVLIVLWILATQEDRAYLSVVICFCAFLANDIYGYWNWKRMYRKQKNIS